VLPAVALLLPLLRPSDFLSLPSRASLITVRVGIRRGNADPARRVRLSETMAVDDDDASTASSMDQPEPPTPLARYTGCPFNALICRECWVSIGKRDSKLTLRQLVKNHERSKHKDNPLSIAGRDTAGSVITHMLTRVAAGHARIAAEDQRRLLQLFLTSETSSASYCFPCQKVFLKGQKDGNDGHKEAHEEIQVYSSIAFVDKPVRGSVLVPEGFDPDDENLLSPIYLKLLTAEREKVTPPTTDDAAAGAEAGAARVSPRVCDLDRQLALRGGSRMRPPPRAAA
jgi:hypothetical protein